MRISKIRKIRTARSITFDRHIKMEGNLDETQRAKLMEIADKCPVHRTLHNPVAVNTFLVGRLIPLSSSRPNIDFRRFIRATENEVCTGKSTSESNRQIYDLPHRVNELFFAEFA